MKREAGRFQSWLWKGTFELEGGRLPADWEGESGGKEGDYLGQLTRYLGDLWRMVDLAEELERGRGAASEDEVAGLLRRLLPVLDALDRVAEYSAQVETPSQDLGNWFRAVDGIRTRLHRTLERVGLQPISAIGSEVDFSIHDVVETRVSREYPENTIIGERQKGYYFRGRLLRDAKVVVALPS